MIGAVFGTSRIGETRWAATLATQVTTGMLLLADRDFAAADLLATLSAGGADLLVRAKSGRHVPPIPRLGDGSALARLGPLIIRVIDAEITIATAAGRVSGRYRLWTTLTDPDTYHALDLIRLYHERWVRHEAPCNRVEVEDLHRQVVAAA